MARTRHKRSVKHLTTSSISQESDTADRRTQTHDLASTPTEQPRWKAAPFRTVTRGAPNRAFDMEHQFEVNEDPAKLDKTLIRVLGKDGDQLLTEEVKWLAVTHKSFDHGRRGFNDRLAFLGME
ncbi:MAG: hypothetical protein Q9220_005778 [cf. Caloplaca sp. 1 TL-2023]